MSISYYLQFKDFKTNFIHHTDSNKILRWSPLHMEICLGTVTLGAFFSGNGYAAVRSMLMMMTILTVAK